VERGAILGERNGSERSQVENVAEWKPPAKKQADARKCMRGDNPKDLLFEKTTAVFAFGVLFLAVLLFALLVRESLPSIRKFGAAFFVTGTWDPVAENFGALPFIYGTLVSSFIALLIAVPLAVGSAIFINEFAPEWMKNPVSFLAELLAAIPSVIYGLWGIFVLVPVLRDLLMKPTANYLGWIPLFKGPVYGPSMLAAGVLLSIMIIPFILSVSREVLATVEADISEVDRQLREIDAKKAGERASLDMNAVPDMALAR
jgi:ABC-type phosphate transport system permease subunit